MPDMQKGLLAFPLFFQRKARRLEAEDRALFELEAEEPAAERCLRLSERSVFAGLWDLHNACGCGVKVRLDAIPCDQVTIELFERAELSPYEEAGGNTVLLVTDSPVGLLSFFGERNIRSSLIGTLTEDNACVVISEAGTRYITPERKCS